MIAAITPLGVTLLVAMVISAVLTHGVLKRAKERPGCLLYGIVALALTILMMLSLGASSLLASAVHGLAVKPRYEASVVSVSSYQSERTDSNNRRSKVTMYTPHVTFIAEDGTRQDLPTNVSSGGRPQIGASITVLYAPGDTEAQEVSATRFGLLLGVAVCLGLMVLMLAGVIQAARGASTEGVKRVALAYVVLVVAPLCLLGMLAGMVYALWQYFAGARPDMPVWAVVMCIFFSLVILLVFYVGVQLALMPDAAWRRPTPKAEQPPGASV